MFKIFRWAFAACLYASSGLGQGVSGDIQSIPYELLEQHATQRIDFEEFATWRSGPNYFTQNIDFGYATIGSTYVGQYVNGQITGKKVDTPLALIPAQDTPTNMPEVPFNTGSYNSNTGAFTISRGERGVFMTNSLLGLSVRGNNVITRYNWHYGPIDSDGYTRKVGTGLDPVSVLFTEDQSAVGFQIVRLNRNEQPTGSTQTGQPRFRVKFFRRDGSLISEVILTPDRNKYVAFARCGGAVDIAGIQITNSTKSGLAYDDFIFAVPRPGPIAPAQSAPLTQPNDTPNQDNPLQVDLCAYYTS